MNPHAFKAGLFIIVAVVATLLMVAFMGDPFAAADQQWSVRFDLARGVGGLQQGDDVRLGGVRVGRVEEVSIVTEDEQAFVRVRFSMPERFVLRDDSRVVIQSRLTGGAWIEVRSLGSGETLAQGALIDGGASDFNQTFDEVARLMPEVRQALHDIRTQSLPQFNATLEKTGQAVEEIRGVARRTGARIDPTLDKYDQLADSGSAALGHVRDLLGDGKGDLRTTISNLASITTTTAERLPDLLERTGNTVDEVQKSAAWINASTEQLAEVLANTRDVTAGVRDLLRDNRPKLDAIIDDVKLTSTEGKNLISEIRRSPWRLLYRPSRDEQDNLDLYASARRLAESAQQVNNAALTLRVASEREDVSQQRLDELITELEAQVEGYSEARSVFFDRLRD